MKNKLRLETYKILFQVILTDNGIEFSLLDEIENDDVHLKPKLIK